MKTLTLESCGGKADGEFDNSTVFARALEELRGGGVLAVGKGVWRTGPIELFSGTTLHLSEGSVISFIPDFERYRPVFTRWEGIECFAMHPLVFCSGQHDVSITGTGRIEGNGEAWWAAIREKQAVPGKKPEAPIELDLARFNTGYETQPGGGGGRAFQFLRPPAVQFYNCRNVSMEGITITNSPFWTVHPVYCDGLRISGVTLVNPHDAPNTDGIDIDSCVDVHIAGCRIAVGDDGIALKSGSGPDGIRVNRPTKHVIVRDCVVGDGHGGIVIGSETAAGVHDVLTENCEFRGTDRGIRIKTRRGRGGTISNLVFRNLTMENNLCPVAINMYYRCGASPADSALFSPEAEPVVPETPHIHSVSISGIRATGCRASAGFIVGLPEAPIRNLKIEKCFFGTDEQSSADPSESDMFLGIPPVGVKSVRVLNAVEPVFSDVTVEGPSVPFIDY